MLATNFTLNLLTNTIQTYSDRKRRHSSPLSSGSSSCQRLEEHRLLQCEGKPCPGCRQTLQQWRQLQAVWWPRQISASLQQCLQSAIKLYFNFNQQQSHGEADLYFLWTTWTCKQDGHHWTMAKKIVYFKIDKNKLYRRNLLCRHPGWDSQKDSRCHTG